MFFVGFEGYDDLCKKDMSERQMELSKLISNLETFMQNQMISMYSLDHSMLYFLKKNHYYFTHLVSYFQKEIHLVEKQLIQEMKRQENLLSTYEMNEWLTFLPSVHQIHNHLRDLKEEIWQHRLNIYVQEIWKVQSKHNQKLLELTCLFGAWCFLKKEIDWKRYVNDHAYRLLKKQRLYVYYEEAKLYDLHHLLLFRKIKALFK